MSESPQQDSDAIQEELHSEFLILSDGTILAHNLTPAMAAVLREVNPVDESVRLRDPHASTPADSCVQNRKAVTDEIPHEFSERD